MYKSSPIKWKSFDFKDFTTTSHYPISLSLHFFLFHSLFISNAHFMCILSDIYYINKRVSHLISHVKLKTSKMKPKWTLLSQGSLLRYKTRSLNDNDKKNTIGARIYYK